MNDAALRAFQDAVEYIDKHPGCILSGPDHEAHQPPMAEWRALAGLPECKHPEHKKTSEVQAGGSE
ncbi:MAG: hypothetical protein M3T56_11725 [Chloroflexota bacterium]|nr:hypothetical protein [Chloroflexota bacterium]